MRFRTLLVLFLLGLSAFPAATAEQRYGNGRFGYSITIPDGFGPAREADNGDGVTVRAVRGDAVLLVYGFHPVSGSFRAEVASAVAGESEQGWDVSYRATGARAASWSGSRGGRIFYVRAVSLCDGAVGSFRLEYDASAKRLFAPVVEGLVRSFRPAPCD